MHRAHSWRLVSSVSVIVASVLWGALGLADPVSIDPGLAAGPPRTDPGIGACATSAWVGSYTGMTGYFDGKGIQEAIRLVDLGKVVFPVTARATLKFKAINFRNNYPGSEGLFTGAGTDEVYFPFSSAPGVIPQGNDRNFAVRVRGYLNVGTPGVMTYSLYGDDFARLSIGGKIVTEAQDGVFAVMTRQVSFSQPGLYPIELAYYQNGSAAVLEMAEADGAQPEGATMNFAEYRLRYRLLQSAELFSAVIGQSSCQECVTDGDGSCRPANYCRDGLCQPCLTSKQCGPSCSPCPTEAPVCYSADTSDQAGQTAACVECIKDGDCLGGVTCNVATHKCNRPACTTDADCPPSQRCDPRDKVCRPIACGAAGVCPAGFQCDTARGVCVQAVYTGGCSVPLSAGVGPAGGGPASAPPWAGLLGLLGLGLLAGAGALRRRGVPQRAPKSGTVRRVGRLLFFSLLLSESLAHAQSTISLNAQPFQPAIGPGNLLTVESSATPGKTTFLGAVLFDYAHHPLRLAARDNGGTLADTVPDLFSAHLQVGVGIWRRFSLGLSLPVVLYQGFDARTPAADLAAAPSNLGVGDLRLVGKVRILNNNQGGLGLAFLPALTAPTGSGHDLRGSDSVGIEARLALDYRTRGGWLFAANLGFVGRTSDQTARGVKISHQVRYGIGALIPVHEEWAVWSELTGGTSVSSEPNGPVYSPIEGYVGGRYTHRSGLNMNLGLGTGFNGAVGSPQLRVIAGVGYLPWRKGSDVDPDLDGVLGAADDCPDDPGPAALRGCPDTDGDGIIDKLDRCPREPGPAENHGCPDRDGDGDGVIDRLDRCPTVAGPRENGGCPDQDRDGDGTVDRLDRCPTVPGPRESNGCPDPDTDHDGVPDRLDRCPTVAGVAPSGCPEKRFLLVTQDKIELKQKIFFATNKARILPSSYDLLNEVAEVLRERPTMTLRIEGHTDSRGSLSLNTRLSKQRARSVLEYLVLAGIDRQRLHSEGYGPTRPIGDNRHATGREQNRRTEFFILTQ